MNNLVNFPLLTETLTPADAAAVAEAVREAVKEGKAIYPRGGGTHWNYGVKPSLGATAGLSNSDFGEQSSLDSTSSNLHPTEAALLNKPAVASDLMVAPGVVLSLEKMNLLIAHAAEDMTVTVEAGMTFAELTKILATKNQRLPIDVRKPEKATLGGLVAVNQAGPRQFGYGTIRDYLLGFTAVDGEGTIFHGGGRVVKNAAGYNMNRLMAGSLGTLGILTQMTFMVRPLPEMSAVVVCELPKLATAEKLLAELNKSQVRPVAIELVTTDGTSTAVRKVATFAERKATMLYVAFEGTSAEVNWMIETLQAEWRGMGVEPLLLPPGQGNGIDGLADFTADARIAVRPSQVVELVAALRERHPDSTIQAHAGTGIVLMESSWGRAEGPSYYRQLRELADTFRGKTTVMSYPEGTELSQDDIWGPPGEGFFVMQAIKERFDPQNILNPGRFIFE